MKSSLLKLYIFAFLFIGDFVMFAQEEPGSECEDENGDPIPGCLENGGDPEAPINTKLIWLALLGVSFVVYYFNRKQQDKQHLQ